MTRLLGQQADAPYVVLGYIQGCAASDVWSEAERLDMIRQVIAEHCEAVGITQHRERVRGEVG
jgi:hypothetical protein